MISRRKNQYPISPGLRQYLYRFGRFVEIPYVYKELTRFTESIPYEDPNGEETLWLSVMYPPEEMKELRPQLTSIYTALKLGQDAELHQHLTVERIDFGSFGNSRPFRIKITNRFNDNSDYYYVKQADASRIYGLELEHILSPNRINYLVSGGNTLIEDHIAGLPGDVFIKDYLPRDDINRVRIAKEFVKFNERCFIRLLGDMRSVNYIVDVTPDFEEVQYRVRPIDFDQQSHDGQGKTYLSYRFPSNKPVTKLAFDQLNRETIAQYVEEERSQMMRRVKAEDHRLRALLSVMRRDELAPRGHIIQLSQELNRLHSTDAFTGMTTMGELTAEHIHIMLEVERTP